MKKYKAIARNISYYYVYVEADDDEKAWDKAMDMDGADFIDADSGDWDIVSLELLNDGK
jgi:hypothetical protein